MQRKTIIKTKINNGILFTSQDADLATRICKCGETVYILNIFGQWIDFSLNKDDEGYVQHSFVCNLLKKKRNEQYE